MKKITSVLLIVFVVEIAPLLVFAEDVEKGKCSITIDGNKHNYDNRAKAVGDGSRNSLQQ